MNSAIKVPQTGDHILLIYTLLYHTILYYTILYYTILYNILFTSTDSQPIFIYLFIMLTLNTGTRHTAIIPNVRKIHHNPNKVYPFGKVLFITNNTHQCLHYRNAIVLQPPDFITLFGFHYITGSYSIMVILYVVGLYTGLN